MTQEEIQYLIRTLQKGIELKRDEKDKLKERFDQVAADFSQFRHDVSQHEKNQQEDLPPAVSPESLEEGLPASTPKPKRRTWSEAQDQWHSPMAFPPIPEGLEDSDNNEEVVPVPQKNKGKSVPGQGNPGDDSSFSSSSDSDSKPDAFTDLEVEARLFRPVKQEPIKESKGLY